MTEQTLDENTPPSGTEENVNTVAEDSDEVDLAKDQSPVLDDAPVEDVEDDTVVSGIPTEGA